MQAATYWRKINKQLVAGAVYQISLIVYCCINIILELEGQFCMAAILNIGNEWKWNLAQWRRPGTGSFGTQRPYYFLLYHLSKPTVTINHGSPVALRSVDPIITAESAVIRWYLISKESYYVEWFENTTYNNNTSHDFEILKKFFF